MNAALRCFNSVSVRHCRRRLATRSSLARTLSAAMSAQVRHHSLSGEEDGVPAEKRQRVDSNQDSGLSFPALIRATSSIGQPQKKQARKQKRKPLPEPCSPEDVLWHDVVALLGSHTVDHKIAQGTEWDSPFGFREEVEVEVSKLSSNGTLPSSSPYCVDFRSLSFCRRRIGHRTGSTFVVGYRSAVRTAWGKDTRPSVPQFSVALLCGPARGDNPQC